MLLISLTVHGPSQQYFSSKVHNSAFFIELLFDEIQCITGIFVSLRITDVKFQGTAEHLFMGEILSLSSRLYFYCECQFRTQMFET